MSNRLLSVNASDLHLWDTPPAARGAEPDWYAAMARPLDEIKRLATEHRVPVVLAGDIFDRYNPGPRLINFAIEHLPFAFAVPGQHDTRHHRFEDLKHSAFWTLCKAKKIHLLAPGEPVELVDLVLHGFPWGYPVTPCKRSVTNRKKLHVAVIHAYCWMRGCSYPGADPEGNVMAWCKRLKTYDAAVTGDNHRGFLWPGRCPIFNGGTLLRRKFDEVGYQPQVGLLYQDRSFVSHRLDCTKDVFSDPPLAGSSGFGDELIAELRNLGDAPVNFRESLLRALDDNKCGAGVRRMVLNATGDRDE